MHLVCLHSHSHIHFQRGDEGFLRDVDLAELAHALLAFLLLLQQLALARGVAAVALGGDVLAEGAHDFAALPLSPRARSSSRDQRIKSWLRLLF